MNNLDLRPLSLGEVLDRTFTLYKRHFVLFLGVAGIPQVLPVALNLAQTLAAEYLVVQLVLLFFLIVVSLVAYLYSQGAAIFAVSKLYLGRPTTIAESLQSVTANLGPVLGVVLLNGIAVLIGFIMLIVPGVYFFCRLLVSVPAALVEHKSPIDALRRSWELTEDNAGRAFLIVLLYSVITYGGIALVAIPLAIVTIFAQEWVLLATVVYTLLASVIGVVIAPILLIATSVFYYDLRVRKEAFDLQIMLDPDSAHIARSGFRSIVPE